MMCSEVWVCVPNPTQNLAFVLAEAGYDVWLGNTRGNKYSCKHRTLKPTEEAFWDFSIDHLALFDMKDAVDYIVRNILLFLEDKIRLRQEYDKNRGE